MATKTLSTKALRHGDRKAPDNDWDTLITLLNTIITELNALRVDYITHDHGASDTYATASLRSAASGGSTDTGATSESVADTFAVGN